MSRLQDIESRLSTIKELLNQDGSDVDALTEETDRLIAERSAIIAKNENRFGLLKKIADNTVPSSVVDSIPQTRSTEENPLSPPAYRSAWLKKVRGIELNEAEKRAYSNASGYGAEAIPTQVSSEIISKVTEKAPLLGKIKLLHVKGNVRFTVESNSDNAAVHTENQSASSAADTTTSVLLSGYEILKIVEISGALHTMSMESFESWIIDALSDKIATKIEREIISGTGSGEPKGVEKANTYGIGVQQ